jgi:cold shock protein
MTPFCIRRRCLPADADVAAAGTAICGRDRRPTGTVKFFNTQKGFGFIAPSDGSKDVFVHISAVERAGMRTLVEGQQVSYDIVTERGKQAAGNLQAA